LRALKNEKKYLKKESYTCSVSNLNSEKSGDVV